MVNSKNIVAALGVVAGFGVAALPLTSYAATTGTETVRVRVADTLEISSIQNNYGTGTTGGTDYVAIDPGAVAASLKNTIVVKGNSYNGYTLRLTAVEGGSTSLRLVTAVDGTTKTFSDTFKIDPVSGTSAVEEHNSAWGFKYSADDSTYESDYRALQAYGDTSATSLLENYANGASTGHDAHTPFENTRYVNYGISTADDVVAGTYETDVLYSVVANAL